MDPTGDSDSIGHPGDIIRSPSIPCTPPSLERELFTRVVAYSSDHDVSCYAGSDRDASDYAGDSPSTHGSTRESVQDEPCVPGQTPRLSGPVRSEESIRKWEELMSHSPTEEVDPSAYRFWSMGGRLYVRCAEDRNRNSIWGTPFPKGETENVQLRQVVGRTIVQVRRDSVKNWMPGLNPDLMPTDDDDRGRSDKYGKPKSQWVNYSTHVTNIIKCQLRRENAELPSLPNSHRRSPPPTLPSANRNGFQGPAISIPIVQSALSARPAEATRDARPVEKTGNRLKRPATNDTSQATKRVTRSLGSTRDLPRTNGEGHSGLPAGSSRMQECIQHADAYVRKVESLLRAAAEKLPEDRMDKILDNLERLFNRQEEQLERTLRESLQSYEKERQSWMSLGI